jgi:hypothetical protein
MGKSEAHGRRLSAAIKAGLAEREKRIRETAMSSVGAILGADPQRAENARSKVRSRLARRHAR